MSAHRIKHSQDRDFYVLRDPEGVNDAIVFTSEAEAYECWEQDPTWLCDSFNPIEGWARPLTDEFQERLEGEQIEARAMQRHYNAMRVA